MYLYPCWERAGAHTNHVLHVVAAAAVWIHVVHTDDPKGSAVAALELHVVRTDEPTRRLFPYCEEGLEQAGDPMHCAAVVAVVLRISGADVDK